MEMLKIAMEFRDARIFDHAFKCLIDRPVMKITVADIRNTPDLVILAYIQAKEAIQTHYRIVAAEPPPVEHVDACASQAACAADWHAAWWNGIARYILDGRNPLDWRDAFPAFERMEFGEMHEECKAKMLAMTRMGEAFCVPVTRFLNSTVKELIERLHLLESPTC
jgi:hypothetical protein